MTPRTGQRHSGADVAGDPGDAGPYPSGHHSAEELERMESASTVSEHGPANTESPQQGRVPSRISQDLRGTASNVLSHMASRLTTRTWPEPPPPPDGGAKAWTQVAMGWLVIFASWGYVNSFGTFQTYYTSALPQSASAISWIGSIQAWLTFVIGAFSGRLLDAGYFVPTFAVGAALHLLGIFMMSISTKYWHFVLAQGVVTGLGTGILFTPSLALVATYFDKHRALAVGMATTGNSIGGILYPIVLRELIPRVGFPWATRVLGFVNMACFAVVLAFMRPRLPPRKSGPVIDWCAFRESPFVAYVGGLFFFLWANNYTFYYIASFGKQTLGLSYTNASLLVTIINGAGLPGRLIIPLFADRLGPLNMIGPITLGLTVISFSWLAVHNLAGFYAFTACYGLGSGAFQCIMPTGLACITRRLDKVGTRLGMCFSIISVAALTGPPIGGAIQAGSGGSFTGAQIFAAVASLLAAVLLAATRVFSMGWDLHAKTPVFSEKVYGADH